MTVVFDAQHVSLRRNIWRSVFILDRFICTPLGRPLSIPEVDFSLDSLSPPAMASKAGALSETHQEALKSVVASCHAIGRICQCIYGDETISVNLGVQLLEESIARTNSQLPALHPRRLMHQCLPTEDSNAILYAELIENYAAILITRPFFQHYLLGSRVTSFKGAANPQSSGSALQRLSRACVTASRRILTVFRRPYKPSSSSLKNPFLL